MGLFLDNLAPCGPASLELLQGLGEITDEPAFVVVRSPPAPIVELPVSTIPQPPARRSNEQIIAERLLKAARSREAMREPSDMGSLR